MAYLVKGGKEFLLGYRDGESLGIITINPKGALPHGLQENRVSTTTNQKNYKVS